MVWLLWRDTSRASPPQTGPSAEAAREAPPAPSKTGDSDSEEVRVAAPNVENPPEDSAPAIVASNHSQPFLTLEGFLEQQFQSHWWGTPGSYMEITQDPMRDVHQILRDRWLNPEGKSLTRQQNDDFERLVAGWAERFGQAHEHTMLLRKQAMVRSAALGRFDVEPAAVVNADARTITPYEGRRAMDLAKSATKNLRQRVQERLGVDRSDWRFTVVNTHEPDGVSRHVLVYFSRYQEPQFFVANDDLSQLNAQRRAALREYLESIP